MMYYISRDQKEYGPYSEQTIREYLGSNSLVRSDFVREETAVTWRTIDQQFGLSAPIPPPPIRPAPVPPPPLVATPQYVPAQYEAPQYAARPFGAPMSQQALPPSLAWGWVLLLCCVPFFGAVWTFVQAGWVKRIDPASKATGRYVVWLISTALYMICLIVSTVNANDANSGGISALLAFVFLVIGAVFLYVGLYDVRRSMVTYYNSVEPINLRMSGAMIFFFNILYLQHHMSRIARWKTTGVLTPQG